MLHDFDIPKVIYKEIKEGTDVFTLYTNQYHTHLLCRQGSLSFRLNGKVFKCKKGEFLFWFAKVNLSELKCTKSFKADVLFVEEIFLDRNIPDQNWSINAMLYTRKQPVKQLDNIQIREGISQNFSRLLRVFEQNEHTFYEEILKLQMRIFILEMWNIFSKQYEKHQSSLQQGSIFERFISLLNQCCLQQREVKFYADKLFITPKYLNYVCKTSSGTTASDWIQSYVKERLEILLADKTRNFAEIADEMDFSSRSFFTRYVKKLFGVTPKAFRERLKE